jgi:choline dehydrogenase-like flavoprotein
VHDALNPFSIAGAHRSRAGLAFAEAMIPGSPTFVGADERTHALAEQLVRSIHPAVATAWRVALELLDSAAVARTGRPFHRLSANQQDALLQRWERDRALRAPVGLVALVYKLVHFDHHAPRKNGSSALGVLRSSERPRWTAQMQRIDDVEETIECDAVVIGTGAGGAVVGRELADQGHAVVFLEEGDFHPREAFDGSAVRAHQRFYRGSISVGNVLMPIFMGRLVGGSTAINGGTCFRTPPWILERWCEDLDTADFAPDAMAPFFERVERVLQVAPADLRTVGPIAGVMARGCDARGWSHHAIQRNAPACDGSGFCDFGCRQDARRSTQVSYLPPALERGAVLFAGARARRVIVEGGRAVGVEVESKRGRRVQVRARAVVLSGGAVPTPLLLLEQGIANRSGQVGRNLSVHPSGGFAAMFDHAIDGHRHVPQGYACDQFAREGILVMAAQAPVNVAPLLFPFAGKRLMSAMDGIDRTASFGLLLRDSAANGRVRRGPGGLPLVTYSVTAEDVTRMHRAMVITGEMCRAAGAKTLYPVAFGVGALEGDDDFARFQEARLAASDVSWLSYHPLGTCRMGRDPRSSVVNLDHETHDVPGLFVVDGSTVPGPLGVNPQLTIMAMATRAAARIGARLS